MNYLVLGAGQMGAAAALDLTLASEDHQVTLADADERRLRQAASWIRKQARSGPGRRRIALTTRRVEIRAATAARLMLGHRVTLSALPYFYNLDLTRAAIRAGCHFCDLGGNTALVRKQLALGPQAARRNLAILPDCGLSPGLASVLGAHAVRQLKKPRALRIFIGGLPVAPRPPLNYQIVFSVQGLINEYDEPCRILRHGVPEDVEPLTEIEPIEFAGWPPLENFMTSGGTSTLPDTFRGQLETVEEKTIRYPGHAAIMAALRALGFFSSQPLPMAAARRGGAARARRAGEGVAPRQVTAQLFERAMKQPGEDAVLLRIVAEGGGERLEYEADVRAERASGLSAMARTTALPASICAQMLADGRITARGGLKQERDVPAAALLAEMEKRGVLLRPTWRSAAR